MAAFGIWHYNKLNKIQKYALITSNNALQEGAQYEYILGPSLSLLMPQDSSDRMVLLQEYPTSKTVSKVSHI